ncbi:MAG: hypothetical protein ABFS32_18415 [Bacteroidota bacterium]
MKNLNTKNIASVILLTLATISIAVSQNTYSVEKIEKLEINGYKAKFNPEGDKVLFTTSNATGLKVYDIAKKEVTEIAETPKAGQGAIITNKEIVFKSQNNLELVDLSTGARTTIQNDKTPGEYLATKEVVETSEFVYVKTNENLDEIILVTKSGGEKHMAPMGRADYLNVALSPDRSKLLFRVSGVGSFITDLNGSVIRELGNVEFPVWLNNEEVIYAEIEDDGYRYISSDLYIDSIQKFERQKLTNTTKAIALYPDISEDQSKVAFSTPNGELYLISLIKE